MQKVFIWTLIAVSKLKVAVAVMLSKIAIVHKDDINQFHEFLTSNKRVENSFFQKRKRWYDNEVTGGGN